jgi:hypothetical protein
MAWRSQLLNEVTQLSTHRPLPKGCCTVHLLGSCSFTTEAVGVNSLEACSQDRSAWPRVKARHAAVASPLEGAGVPLWSVVGSGGRQLRLSAACALPPPERVQR